MTETMVRSEAEKKERKDKSFREFLEKPETKLVMSLIPPSENPEAMQTLMRSAFDAGTGHGQGEILVEMIGAMFKDRPREQR